MDQWVTTLFTDVFQFSLISGSRNTLIRREPRTTTNAPKNRPLRQRRLDDLGRHHVGLPHVHNCLRKRYLDC
ncbi:hypothetical protein TNCV_2969741 [Trichonephila clavipes]|nr:hypothetical protein TNCV_2969741 [Trichonephila clavipes]